MRRFKVVVCLRIVFCVILVPFSFAGAGNDCTAVFGDGSYTLRLATGSPGELGLVEALAEVFNKKNDTRICWIKAGSGKSLNMLKTKWVDLVMVHAPFAEEAAVRQGWAVKRSLIGSNEFFLVGPKHDPAGIGEAKSAADAFKRIASSRERFLSRGDNSGTHKKEMGLWKAAGIVPSGPWYITTQSFMMATLKQADVEEGYFMTDSSTWVAAKKELKHLKICFQGDPILINTYHALCQPTSTPQPRRLAEKFIDFVVSVDGQKIISSYGVEEFGEPLYHNAEHAKTYDH